MEVLAHSLISLNDYLIPSPHLLMKKRSVFGVIIIIVITYVISLRLRRLNVLEMIIIIMIMVRQMFQQISIMLCKLLYFVQKCVLSNLMVLYVVGEVEI